MNVLRSLLLLAVTTALMANSAQSAPLRTLTTMHGHTLTICDPATPDPDCIILNDGEVDIDDQTGRLVKKDFIEQECPQGVSFNDNECLMIDRVVPGAEMKAKHPFRSIIAVCKDPDNDGECGGVAPIVETSMLAKIGNWLEAGRRHGPKTPWSQISHGPGHERDRDRNGSPRDTERSEPPSNNDDNGGSDNGGNDGGNDAANCDY